MSKYSAGDLNYRGESNGVHHWTLGNQPYYWHPDWLHIAEDMTGETPIQEGKLEVEHGEKPTQEHAVNAIVKHLNEWVHKHHK
ncbi:hypothetical protein [Enterovibrio paralichthyis]|uniref:hypothetical protein n=1 Tax=Enterovibrio paralichthyis TaxID=2853805 RepID=UPI0006D0DD4B|nr:hypothetical protein [Enterovibrio paralichthyis]